MDPYSAHWNVSSMRVRALFTSAALMPLTVPGQSSHSVNICWMNECVEGYVRCFTRCWALSFSHLYSGGKLTISKYIIWQVVLSPMKKNKAQDGLLCPSHIWQDGFITQNLVWMSRRIKSHTAQQGMKGFTACIMRLSGESRTAPTQVQKWLERTGKGDWLGVFMVVKG